jgi:deoxyribodipyrimidine photo-lyase
MTSLLQHTARTTVAKSASSSGVGLVFFRYTDIRLHDHEPLHLAHKNHNNVVHCFCFDPRVTSSSASVDFSKSLPKTGYLKTGVFRSKFLLEAVADLQANLKSYNHDLLVYQGTPESILPTLVSQYNVNVIYAHEGETVEENILLSSIDDSLKQIKGCTMKRSWGNTLYHINDLPFNPRQAGQFPPTSSSFRTKVEKNCSVRKCFPIPSSFKSAPQCEHKLNQKFLPSVTTIPSLSDLVGEELANHVPLSTKASFQFVGGETAALARMKDYFFSQDCLKDYFHTRNGMLGANYSSKFAPWLSTGSLSPRMVYQEVSRYEKERVKNKDTYWMVFELTVRDYFRYYALHWDSSIYHLWGPKGKIAKSNSSKSSSSVINTNWSQDLNLFERWRLGTTGNPMIDANMRELLTTGFMSNRGRQIVASYLTRDLGLDWRLGAMHFESLLIDHDPCSNWGNWTYAAGVGSDPRENRYFSIPKQTKNYDPKHEYIRHWVEEMNGVSEQQLRNQLTRGCRKQTFGGGGQKSDKNGKKGKNKNNNKRGSRKGKSYNF